LGIRLICCWSPACLASSFGFSRLYGSILALVFVSPRFFVRTSAFVSALTFTTGLQPRGGIP
jgi:hypothetical protein